MVERKERKEPLKEDVSQRAYQLYVQRGCEPGKDVEDWVRAEEELNSDLVVVGPVRTKAALAGHA
jgi:hypothetical protein